MNTASLLLSVFKMASQMKKANAALDLRGKTALVTGATQGIGEGIALRCAQLGVGRIFLVGRNQQKGNAVLEKLKALAKARPQSDQTDSTKDHFEFVQADLSTIQTVKQTATDLQAKIGSNGLDYLLMTQGGPPNGIYEENSEGYEKSFAVHCLSRFGLMYLLAESKTLKEDSTVVSVFSPGYNYPEIDLEDLSLKKLHATKPWRTTMLLSQGKRDSMITDAFTLEFNRRYPWIKFYHIFPGYVQTNAAANRGLPFPIPQLGSVFGPILAHTVGNTPLSYSDIPLYLAANPEAKKLNGFMFNEKLKKMEVGKWNQDQGNREKVFDKLRSLF